MAERGQVASKTVVGLEWLILFISICYDWRLAARASKYRQAVAQAQKLNITAVPPGTS